ncbi:MULTISPECIES: hypothetical protein [Parachlamydia]|uniref:ATP synthase protein I n=2 Tax=Parachlamydia acanthamoebae TaxID=83552 RepID=F8L1Z8_PARAV|nr:hypothetical protein [Parachlamydia acanthamoebae]EFB40228.1 hypothetical protein pah_c221o017 [Parachlamydia acanthamoebae str. Hall's coccus]KIA76993.1 hypothetical protein DB43_HA00120 [Parachlamydia acanthamoebae]CCB87312.1 putative uncharacterized protein [Parachlamydia acanthamoebae UV-7]
MELDFIKNTIKVTLGLTFIFLVIILQERAYKNAASLCLGVMWGCANLFLLKYLLKSILGNEQKNVLKIFTLMGLKIPLLYLLGYFLLASPYLNSLYLVLGFSLIFLGIFLLGLGSLMFQKRTA